jgi:hypothetical protein
VAERRSLQMYVVARHDGPAASVVEDERDVLRELVRATRRAFVLWDEWGRMVWSSPEAAAHFDAGLTKQDLEGAAARAARRLVEI